MARRVADLGRGGLTLAFIIAVATLTIGCSSPPTIQSSSAEELKENVRPSGQLLEAQARPAPDELPPDALTAVLNAPSLEAHASPDSAAPLVASFDFDPTYPQYFLATKTYDEYQAQDDTTWLEVLLPVRPNGTTGWVQADQVVLYQNRFNIEIDVSDHSMTLFERGREVFTTPIGVGTGDTPTPIGSFFTTVLYDVPDPEGPFGPYAFALSGFSEILTSFNGGDGLIGIHGTNDPNSLGSDISHGCIRIPNELITQMAESVPLGTPVDIVP